MVVSKKKLIMSVFILDVKDKGTGGSGCAVSDFLCCIQSIIWHFAIAWITDYYGGKTPAFRIDGNRQSVGKDTDRNLFTA